LSSVVRGGAAIYEALDGAYPPTLENSLSKNFERDAQWRAKSPLDRGWGRGLYMIFCGVDPF